jgi:hypothetical protein
VGHAANRYGRTPSEADPPNTALQLTGGTLGDFFGYFYAVGRTDLESISQPAAGR